MIWIGGYFLTGLPDCIPRNFKGWESNLNEDGRRWFSGLRLDLFPGRLEKETTTQMSTMLQLVAFKALIACVPKSL